MNSVSRKLFLKSSAILAVALLTACSGANRAVLKPETQLRSEKFLERGVSAQLRGESARAEELFLEALTTSSSIEHNPVRSMALINLARLKRLQGSPAKAAFYIDQAIETCYEQQELVSEAAYEKAHIELDQGRHGDAMQWAVRALNAEQGISKGIHRNLLARIQYDAGDTSAARLSAETALQENRHYDLPTEEANSLRLLGAIEIKYSQWDDAKTLLMQALEIDKRVGASSKIAEDLEKLAAVGDAQGQLDKKFHFLERACVVHLAAGRKQKARQILQQLVEGYRKSGQETLAKKAAATCKELENSTTFNQPGLPQKGPDLPATRNR